MTKSIIKSKMEKEEKGEMLNRKRDPLQWGRG